jgi:hypothetical protein
MRPIVCSVCLRWRHIANACSPGLAWLQALRLQDMTSQMMAEMSDDFIKQLEDLTEVDKKIGACLALDGWVG